METCPSCCQILWRLGHLLFLYDEEWHKAIQGRVVEDEEYDRGVSNALKQLETDRSLKMEGLTTTRGRATAALDDVQQKMSGLKRKIDELGVELAYHNAVLFEVDREEGEAQEAYDNGRKSEIQHFKDFKKPILVQRCEEDSQRSQRFVQDAVGIISSFCRFGCCI